MCYRRRDPDDPPMIALLLSLALIPAAAEAGAIPVHAIRLPRDGGRIRSGLSPGPRLLGIFHQGSH